MQHIFKQTCDLMGIEYDRPMSLAPSSTLEVNTPTHTVGTETDVPQP